MPVVPRGRSFQGLRGFREGRLRPNRFLRGGNNRLVLYLIVVREYRAIMLPE